MDVTYAWTCPTCLHTLNTPYCHGCGEQILRPRDLTLHGLFDQIVAAFSNIDSKLILTFRKLILKPGILTAGYQRGQRKPYVLPINLFLFTNVLFFAVQSFATVKIFATPLDMHLHNQFWYPLAQFLVTTRTEITGLSVENYAPIFDNTVGLHAKTLIGLMVLPLSAMLALIYYRSKQPFVVHVVFALHFFTFLMLLWSTVLLFVMVKVWSGGAGLESESLDHILSIIQGSICFTYLHIASRTVYTVRGISAISQTIGLMISVVSIFFGYRFLLFLITLYTT